METMLQDRSIKAIQDDFQTFPKVIVQQEKEAWKWLKDLDKKSMLHWYGHTYIVPSTRNPDHNSSLWLKQYATFSWQSFDDFSRWLFAGRLVTLPMMCSCRNNLKTYVCKHALGISIHFGLYVISDPGKLEDLGKRRGRPKKAKLALSR